MGKARKTGKSYRICSWFLAALVAVAPMAGFAGDAREGKHSGFLENYPEFQKGKEGIDLVYVKPGASLKGYNKIMMDHVVFYLKEESGSKVIDPNELKELAEKFHWAFFNALAEAYPFTDAPGPDVLRIRTAITNLEPGKPGVSAVTTVLPVGLAISVVKKAAGGTHTGVGSASLEAEFLDSTTNERIAAVIETEAGSKLSGLTKWGSAEEAFEFWAKRMRARMDADHGKK